VRNPLVTLAIAERAESFVTSVLDLSEDENALVVDSSPNRFLNEALVEAERVSFETSLDKVRILFSSTCMSTCLHEGRPALLLEIPDRLVRLQRREYYRVPTPLVDPLRCVIPLPEELGCRAVTLPLLDISCGGIAVMEEKPVLDEAVGRQYDACRIELPGIGTVVTGLQVRDSQELVLANGKRRRRIGLKFVNLSNAMLAAVQRYIMKLEREQNARTSGLA
jgi:c-di-GMP-binding flagellar brake protein YcgR